jgi:hypothetical protein
VVVWSVLLVEFLQVPYQRLNIIWLALNGNAGCKTGNSVYHLGKSLVLICAISPWNLCIKGFCRPEFLVALIFMIVKCSSRANIGHFSTQPAPERISVFVSVTNASQSMSKAPSIAQF